MLSSKNLIDLFEYYCTSLEFLAKQRKKSTCYGNFTSYYQNLHHFDKKFSLYAVILQCGLKIGCFAGKNLIDMLEYYCFIGKPHLIKLYCQCKKNLASTTLSCTSFVNLMTDSESAASKSPLHNILVKLYC